LLQPSDESPELVDNLKIIRDRGTGLKCNPPLLAKFCALTIFHSGVARYDNSKENPHNPDPDVAVRWGEQTYDEMMVGFFDVAVPASLDKQHFFIRAKN